MAKPTTASTQGSKQGRLALGGTSSGSAPRPYASFVPGPNPTVPDFIAKHGVPYDPRADTYDVPAFDRDLVVNKFASPKAIYDMHSYWSKKHWATIAEYIRHYLPPKFYPAATGIVLDTFSGSGMTGVAAMTDDRPCLLVDASPAAAFISHCYTHPVDPEKLEAAYQRLLTEPYSEDLRRTLRASTGAELTCLSDEFAWLYETRCDRCGGKATTEYVVYSERLQCGSCAEIVPLFDCPEAKVPYQIGGKAKQKTELKKKRVCPHCLEKSRGNATREFVISTRGKRFGQVPVLVRYVCEGACKPSSGERSHRDDRRSKKGRYFEDYDLARITRIAKGDLPHRFPDGDLWEVLKYRLQHKKDFRPDAAKRFADLYMRRTLWAYAAFVAAVDRTRTAVGYVELLRCAQTALAFRLSRMTQFTPQYSFPLPILSGTYHLPPICKEASVLEHLPKKVRKVLAANAALNERCGGVSACVTQQGTRSLDLPDNSIDYVFTDPAYVDKIQYGELNFVWESWLGFDGSWLKDEIVVNPYRSKTVEDWDADMRRVLALLYAALKPSRWLSLCYHDTDPGTWARLQNMLLDAGFEIHTVTVLDPKQKSSNQLTAEKVVKSDLVVNCRKPKPGERGENGNGEVTLVSQRVRDILVETLSNTGGQARDRLWDLILKRLLARGQMAEHRFDEILSEVASRSEAGRWFLKEDFESLSENDIKNEEKAGDALVRFARLRMAGVPAALASEIVLRARQLADDVVDEKQVEKYIRDTCIKDKKEADKFELSGRLKGVEFYDCLFFYLTRWLKGRGAGKTPRRNLAEFLDEYLVRFKEGDKWLHRAPDDAETQTLRKARHTGLGRRIRQYVSFLRGEGEYPRERMPDGKTLVAWLKHCAAFGLAEEGVALFEKGGLVGQLAHLSEDDRYDAEDYYAQCRRRAGKSTAEEDTDGEEPGDEEEGDE